MYKQSIKYFNFLRFNSTSTTTVRDSRLLRFNTPKGFIQEVPSPEDEIIISMSSGVDSSVCALMYAEKYKNVRGIFMANWSSDKFINGNSKCTIDDDWLQVKEICNQINIPCERVNFEKEYWTQVFEPMLKDYENGLTPNPDIGCNKYVKFGKMIEYLQNYYNNKAELGRNKRWWLVTGHYAKILKANDGVVHGDEDNYRLFRADYKNKDQSYYLTSIPSKILNRILMPIGHYSKPEIRSIAQDYNLLTKDKPDSQGLCFVSQIGRFKDFLNEYLVPKPGNIVTKDGKIWGKHNGLWSATIGQKSGISMPQGDPKYKGIWLISDKNVEKNELIISRKDDYNAFYKDKIIVDKKTWYNLNSQMDLYKLSELNELKDYKNLNVQIRSLQTPNLVENIQVNDKNLNFTIDSKIFGVAPGQTLALYANDMLVGSGVIVGSH